MDWLDQRQGHSVEFLMVSPGNLDTAIGAVDGVDLSASSVSASFSTDTRTSAKLRVVGDGWVRNTYIRIVVHYPGSDRELGTYAVADAPMSIQDGMRIYDMELQSLMWAFAQDACPYPLTVGAGVMAMAASSRECGFAHDFTGAYDVKVTAPVTYTSGVNRLKRHLDLCSMAGNRAEVDGHGLLYVEPADTLRPVSARISLSDPRGITHGAIQRSSDFTSRPNMYGVAYRWTESGGVQREVGGHAWLEGNSSASARGYTVSDVEILSELDPPTHAHAMELAAKRLGGAQESVTWKFSCRYLPIWEGDTVELDVADADPLYGGIRTCRVESLEMELQHMDMTITLKEA